MEEEHECLKIIRVKCYDVWIRLYIGLIVYCEAQGECTRIYVRYGASYLVTGGLTKITALIGCPRFYALGRSWLVNTDYFSLLWRGRKGYTFSFAQYGHISPAPLDGVMRFMKLVELMNTSSFWWGQRENNKTRNAYMKTPARKPPRNPLARPRWKWEWHKMQNSAAG